MSQNTIIQFQHRFPMESEEQLAELHIVDVIHSSLRRAKVVTELLETVANLDEINLNAGTVIVASEIIRLEIADAELLAEAWAQRSNKYQPGEKP